MKRVFLPLVLIGVVVAMQGQSRQGHPNVGTTKGINFKVTFGDKNSIPNNAKLSKGKPLLANKFVVETVPPAKGVPVKPSTTQKDSPLDTFNPASGNTDANGKWSSTVYTRRKDVEVLINKRALSPPARHNMLPAKYMTKFLATVYYIALETDYDGDRTQAGEHGLAEPHLIKFLQAVQMNGSGKCADGKLVSIDYSSGWKKFDTCKFKHVSVITTRWGTLRDSTIAVDPTVIPRKSAVNLDAGDITIPGGNARTADDTGTKIKGYHMDIFCGFGKASKPTNWNNPSVTAILTNY